MAAVAKYGSPNPVSKLPDGHNRVGSGYIVGEDIAVGDAVTLALNSTAITAGVPTMQIMRADATGGDLAKAVVVGFAPQVCKVAQADACTILRDMDWNYGSGLITSFLTAAAGPVYVYPSATVKGGLDTTPPWVGCQPVGMIIDDTRIRLWGSIGIVDFGGTPGLLSGLQFDEFAIAATGGNGGAFAWQNTYATPIFIPPYGLTADVQTVASGACTLSVGNAVNATTSGSNLLSAQDVHTATGLFSNTTGVKIAAGAWITGTLSAPTAFVGNLILAFRQVAN